MSTKQAQQKLSLADLTITDADSHIKPTLEDILEYIEPDDAARSMLERAGNVDSEIFTQTRASAGFPNDSGTHPGSIDGVDSINEHGYTPAGKGQFMDEFGIDACVISPAGNTGGGALATINHDPTAVSYASAYNSYLLDQWLDEDDRFYGNVLVANQIPHLAAEEIDRHANEDNIVGVQLPAAGLVPPAGHRSYQPIYETAQSHGFPIVMHTHDVQATVTFPIQRQWAETFTESHAFTFPAESMWHLISLICNGVPERYPDLNFVMQEPGFEWVPWMMWRLDDHYLQNSHDLPMLTKEPSEYIRDQFYFTTQPLGHTENKKHLGWTMEMAGGADTIMFSSDHPHPDFDPPNEVFLPASTHLDNDDIRGIMGETAAGVFNLS